MTQGREGAKNDMPPGLSWFFSRSVFFAVNLSGLVVGQPENLCLEGGRRIYRGSRLP